MTKQLRTVGESERLKATRDSDGYRVATTFLDSWDDEEKTVFTKEKPKCDCAICKGFPE